jgi:hypothetical protein
VETANESGAHNMPLGLSIRRVRRETGSSAKKEASPEQENISPEAMRAPQLILVRKCRGIYLKLFLRLRSPIMSISSVSSETEKRPITRMAKRDYPCPASAHNRSSPASPRTLIQSHTVSYFCRLFLQKLGHKMLEVHTVRRGRDFGPSAEPYLFTCK